MNGYYAVVRFSNDHLAHSGTKGMKWSVRKPSLPNPSGAKILNNARHEFAIARAAQERSFLSEQRKASSEHSAQTSHKTKVLNKIHDRNAIGGRGGSR